MPRPTSEVLRELDDRLKGHFAGEVALDAYTRALYATDGSIHEITPLGVAWPRTGDDLCALVGAAAELKVPVLPRGAGTSLAGQAVGAALVIDCSRYLRRLRRIEAEAGTAEVEPGLVAAALNRHAAAHGLMLGPDPASIDRATLGGMVGNNASGAHSIRYGLTADHVVALDVVLSDGTPATLGPESMASAESKARSPSRLGGVYRAALAIQSQQADIIRQDWPKVWRRASGYNLNYLVGHSPGAPPAWYDPARPYAHSPDFNLAPLLTGSEGTLALTRSATIRLVPRPAATVLVILPFSDIPAACDAVPELLLLRPDAIELIPGSLIARARAVPGYARRLTFTSDPGAALLVAEFTGASLAEARHAAGRLEGRGLLLDCPAQQADVWAVRRAGMGLLMNLPGPRKPVDFVEDLAVPVERLGDFVRTVDGVLAAHGTAGEWYAHASAGCLHMRPLLDLKTAHGVAELRSIAHEIAEVVAAYGGAMSGEHGDGLSRTEFIERIFGPRLSAAFAAVKQVFDPERLFNPGKIVVGPDDPKPAVERDLRYGPEYRTIPLHTHFAFAAEGGLAGAVERCVGAGVCLKDDGVMCPSYQATREEAHTTRGRANALRAALAGKLPPGAYSSHAMHNILDLCLECKGCRAECPTGVDMARIKAEWLSDYQARHGVPLRNRLFGQIAAVGRWVRPVAPLVNALNRLGLVRWLLERAAGIDRRRTLPPFRARSFRSELRGRRKQAIGQEVVLFVDTYLDNHDPAPGRAALKVLEAAGFAVTVVPKQGCCGRPMISKGLLAQAKAAAARNLAALAPYAEQGVPIVGLEPSCLLALRDEYLDFFPDDPRARAVAGAALLIEEFLMLPGADGQRPVDRLRFKPTEQAWRLHAHCHAKSLVGSGPTLALLRATGAVVDEIPSGCCGMAGSFGYEHEHYDLSMQIGELVLFPAARAAQADGVRVAAPGVSCRSQLAEGAGVRAVHPIVVVAESMMEFNLG